MADLNPPPPGDAKFEIGFIKTDIVNWISISTTFESVVKKYGTLDCVYANAGIGEYDHLFVTPKDTNGKPKAPNFKAIDVK